MLRVALIGFGAIGRGVLGLLRDDDAEIAVVAVVVRQRSDAIDAALAELAPGAVAAHAVPCDGVDLVLEAAGHGAITEHVLPALRRGTPCVVASVGALAEPGLPEQIEAAARAGGTQLRLIAGAVGAIDALAAARLGGLETVRYTGRKPVHAWLGTPAERQLDLATLTHERVIFQGSARDAAALYPKNANVAATVSLAGLGLDRTEVRLIADPGATHNVHRIEAHGAFGAFELTLRNQALASNPKTSALTVYSALRALRDHAAPLVI